MPVEEQVAVVLTDGPIPQVNAEESERAEVEGDEQEPQATQEVIDEEAPEGETPEDKHKRLSGYQRQKAKVQRIAQERDFWRTEALRNRPQQDVKPEVKPEDERPKPPSVATYQGTAEAFDKELAEYPARLEKYLEAKREKEQNAQAATERVNVLTEKLKAMPELEELAEAINTAKISQPLVDLMKHVAAPLKNGADVIREVLLDEDLREQLLQLDKTKNAQAIATHLQAISTGLLIANRKLKAEDKKEEPSAETRAPRPAVPVNRPRAVNSDLSDSEPYPDWLRKRDGQVKARRGY